MINTEFRVVFAWGEGGGKNEICAGGYTTSIISEIFYLFKKYQNKVKIYLVNSPDCDHLNGFKRSIQ